MTKKEQAQHLSKVKKIDMTTAYTWLRNNTWDECLKKTRMTKAQAAKRSRRVQGRNNFRLPGSPIFLQNKC